jgi:hypothetical protein
VLTPPTGLQSWSDQIDLRPAKPLIVTVDAELDPVTGVASWHLQGLDPETRELQTDPFIGFLDPNQEPPEGQGGVTFSVDPVGGLGTGDTIPNGASIVFDMNEAIQTPTFSNTIDDTPPRSEIKSIKAKGGSCSKLAVKFGGKDKGAGIAHRDVFVSRNGKKYEPWRLHTRKKKGEYGAKKAGAYAFLSVATDGAGHTEESAEGLWDAIVKGVKRTGSSNLVISFDKKAAKQGKVKSLQISVDGRKRGKGGKVPGKLTLRGLRDGGHEIALKAKRKGKPKTVKDDRVVASCPAKKKKGKGKGKG